MSVNKQIEGINEKVNEVIEVISKLDSIMSTNESKITAGIIKADHIANVPIKATTLHAKGTVNLVDDLYNSVNRLKDMAYNLEESIVGYEPEDYMPEPEVEGR